MDKRNVIKEIGKKLLKEKLDNKNVIEGKRLDKIIFITTKNYDKNIKYEFRNLLLIFELINRYKSPDFFQNDAFIVEIENIKNFLQGKYD